MDAPVDPQGVPARRRWHNGSAPEKNGPGTRDYPILLDLDADEAEADPLLDVRVVSVDPGTVHCAVVRYDGSRDRFTHAELLNLFCTCPPEARGKGPLAASLGSIPGLPKSGGGKRKKKKAPPPRVPSAHDFPRQLAERIRQHRQGLFQEPMDVMALEKQNAMDTGNMMIQASLHTHYLRQTRLQVPKQVKLFWNGAAHATESTIVPFRLSGSHSVNKTDAKNLGRCVLGPSEQSMLRAAAARHHGHRQVCPTMRRKDRKRKRKDAAPKMDDLFDAALQAIAAAYQASGVDAQDTSGPAALRLVRGRRRQRIEALHKEATKQARAAEKKKNKASPKRRKTKK